MTEENARQGRRNQSAGKRWQQDCAAWLRANGWPSAGYEIRNHSSDLIGTWDLAIECTITGWDKIWIKLDQAHADAVGRKLSDYLVWKKRNGTCDPGKGALIIPAEVGFPLMMRLEKLEQGSLSANALADQISEFVFGGQNAYSQPSEANKLLLDAVVMLRAIAPKEDAEVAS